jgi:hypothetical protein
VSAAEHPSAAVGERRRLLGLAAVLIACLPMLAAVRGALIWTDIGEIVEGGLIRSGRPLLRALVGGIEGQYYRPTILLLHSVEAAAFGASATAFRATNGILHALNAVLVLLLFRRLTANQALATTAACLFAVHPLGVTVVSWASDRTDAVALLAILLAALWADGTPHASVGVLAILLVGLGAKETAAAAVPIVALLAWRAGPGQERRRMLVLAALMAALCLAWFAWRAHLATNPLPAAYAAAASPLDRAAVAVKVHAGYAWELVAPWRLRVCDDVTVPPWRWAVVALALAGAAAALRWLRPWRARPAAAGPLLMLGWLAATLLPTSGVVPLRHVRADRYLYAALPAVMYLASAALFRLPRRARIPTAVAICLALAVLTVRRAQLFRSDERLWTQEVETSPTCREGHAILARVRQLAADARGAIQEGEAALAPVPGLLASVDEAAVNVVLGLARLTLGEPAQAEALFRAAVQNSRGARRAEAMYDLGLAMIVRGDVRGAVPVLEEGCAAAALPPASQSDCRLLLAYALARAGALSRARAVLDGVDASAPSAGIRGAIQAELRRMLR